MKIITAFDSFKGCMTANEACKSAATGILELYPDAEVICLPMSDGGEGMVECIAEAVSANMVSVQAHDPLMRMIKAQYAVSPDGETAYMEMAASSGLPLVPIAQRNPMITTTFGVGDMLLDAVNRGCKHVVMGIGGSATCDGGKGMIECLHSYLPLPVDITVASDVSNPLFGQQGAAYVFAPQKGATPDQVLALDARLREFARETEALGLASPSLAQHPGAGAAGGLGYGLMAYLNAKLVSGIDLILDTIRFDERIEGADLIITGEGKSDSQTLMGKVPMGVLQRAKKKNIPVVLMSGAIEEKDQLLNAGFSNVLSINEGDKRTLSELMKTEIAEANLTNAVKALRF